jgi:serpin B
MLQTILALTLAAPAALPADAAATVAAANQFAVDVYRQLAARDGTVFFSPYSIDKTLAMVWAGARGETAREMASVLHFTFDPDRQHRAFADMRRLLNTHSAQPGLLPARHDAQLFLAAGLWGQRGGGFAKSFRNLLTEHYGATLEEVDFAESDRALQSINTWAAENTHGKVPRLLPDGALHPTTRLVLASAIYFKGDWVHTFRKDATRSETFHVSRAESAPVPMMNQTATFGYFEDEQLQCLRLPYAGKDLAMVVWLPKKADGLATLEATLTGQTLSRSADRLREQKVEVALPKFKLTGDYALDHTLEALGMKKAFDIGTADFSGMNGGREPLAVSAVVHKAFVDVHEQGTEAAAATAAVVGTLSAAAGPAVPVFRADHPFLFAICDVRTGLVLFLGRMARP